MNLIIYGEEMQITQKKKKKMKEREREKKLNPQNILQSTKITWEYTFSLSWIISNVYFNINILLFCWCSDVMEVYQREIRDLTERILGLMLRSLGLINPCWCEMV